MNGVVGVFVCGCVGAFVRAWSIFICEGNQQLKRSGANGFQTGKDMSSFLSDTPYVGDTIGSSLPQNSPGSDSPILRCYWSEGPHRSSPDPAEGIN